MGKLKKGYIQVYTGNGKGKTTAAIGQAIRSAGFGFKIYIAQFMKDYPYNELKSLAKFNDSIIIEQFGNDNFVFAKETPNREMISEVRRGLDVAKKKMLSGLYNIVMLDEVCVSIYFKLLSVEEVMKFIEFKPADVELILTGRYCPDEIIDIADLVTEMKNIKHYYDNGIDARKGIES